MNKKGDVFQILFLLIMLFIAGIVGLLFLKMTTGVLDAYPNLPTYNVTPELQHTQEVLSDSAPRTTDYMIFFLFLFGYVGITISAVRTKFSPMTMFFFAILAIITIFVSSGMVNIYQGFAQSDALIDTSSQLTFTNFMFSQYTPAFMLVISAMVMIIMWGRSGSDIVT